MSDTLVILGIDNLRKKVRRKVQTNIQTIIEQKSLMVKRSKIPRLSHNIDNRG